jgi:ABC-2 type transport system permease protein
MSRMKPVIKREFTEAVGSKAFLIGTVLGPLLIVGLFAVQFLILARSGGGDHRIAILDASGLGLGDRVVRVIEDRPAGPSFISRATLQLSVETPDAADRQAAMDRAAERVVAKELEGFVWIPADVLNGANVEYEGSNATNSQVTGDVRQAVQRVVQSERLRMEGIEESRVGTALQPVRMDIVKTGERGRVGNPAAAMMLAFGMAFAIYIVVIMYGQSIMTSVQEEKRDRIVELIVSSIRARDLLIGKVLGIGGAGVLQMSIWVLVAALIMTQGAAIASMFGASQGVIDAMSQRSFMPQVPASVGVAFILYFAGGFFLFATLFAIIGSIVTNAQEAQQFVFPILLPFIIGLFIAMAAAENPNSTVAVIGSIVPFTSPMVMPVRISVAGMNPLHFALSIVLLYLTALAIIAFAAKVYRTAIFATGKKPTVSEIWRWMRAA